MGPFPTFTTDNNFGNHQKQRNLSQPVSKNTRQVVGHIRTQAMTASSRAATPQRSQSEKEKRMPRRSFYKKGTRTARRRERKTKRNTCTRTERARLSERVSTASRQPGPTQKCDRLSPTSRSRRAHSQTAREAAQSTRTASRRRRES